MKTQRKKFKVRKWQSEKQFEINIPVTCEFQLLSVRNCVTGEIILDEKYSWLAGYISDSNGQTACSMDSHSCLRFNQR